MSEYIFEFGGHEKAAGLTLEIDKFDDFKREITNNIAESMKNIEIVTYYDDEIVPGKELNLEFAKKLSILEPFGEDNPNPVFLLKDVYCPDVEFMKNPKHLQYKWNNISIKYFNGADRFLDYKNFTRSDNLVKVSTSLYNGNEYLSVTCDDALFYDLKPSTDYLIANNKLKVLKNRLAFKRAILTDIDSVKEQKNFVILCYDNKNFRELEKIFGDTVTYSVGNMQLDEKRRNICFMLENSKELVDFERVYFTEESMSYILDCENKYLIEGDFNDITLLSNPITRVELGLCYTAIKNIICESESEKIENFKAESIYYDLRLKYSNMVSLEKFIFAILLFEELGLIVYDGDDIKITNDKKDLSKSELLKYCS